MIGGATTSKAHTAVKIDPQYHNDAVVYVTDASRAVGVATTLLSKELKPAFVEKTREEYAMIRERTANRSARTERLSYAQAEIGRATSELQSLMRSSYAVFCLKKKNNKHNHRHQNTE